MGRHQREKGKKGEREWASQLTEAGFPAHRGRQYKGTDDSPDVLCPVLDPLFHCEVKRVERLSVSAALDQARSEAGPMKLTYLAHRRDRHPWLVTMAADDWFKLLRTAYMELASSEFCDGQIDGVRKVWTDDQLDLNFTSHSDGRRE